MSGARLRGKLHRVFCRLIYVNAVAECDGFLAESEVVWRIADHFS